MNLVQQNIIWKLNIENLTEYGKFTKRSRFTQTIKSCKAYRARFYFRFYFFLYFFILRGNLQLLDNALIVKRKEYGFDIKKIIFFIDCLNSRKQRFKAVSSCSVWSAIRWSIEQGSKLVAPFLSNVLMTYTAFVENSIKFDNSNQGCYLLNIFK